MLAHLYRLIWHSLQFVLCICETLRMVWTLLRRQQRRSHDHLRGGKAARRALECAQLRRCRSQLQKVPQHIAIIVGADERRFDDDALADLLTYALTMEVGCISYYDARLPDSGRISLEKFSARRATQCRNVAVNKYLWYVDDADTSAPPRTPVSRSPASNGKCQAPNGVCANGNAKASNGVGGTNSSSTECRNTNSLQIYEIDAHDGRPLIADVCRNLFEYYHSTGNAIDGEPIPAATVRRDELKRLLSERAQLMQRIDDELSQRLGDITEPDLGIIISRCMCTYGMLPWHTRFTEFHTLDADCVFSAKEFVDILCNYARCEQRWGR